MITEKNIENRKVGNSLKQLKIETIKNCLLAKGLIYQEYLRRLRQSNQAHSPMKYGPLNHF